MRLSKTIYYSKVEKKFLKKHKNLLDKYKEILIKLTNNPFDNSLKTHKLKGNLSDFYACSLTFEYRIVMVIKIIDDEIILANIGTHDDVYGK